MINDIIRHFQLAQQTTSFKTHNNLIKQLLTYDSNTYYQIHLDFISQESEGMLHERLCRSFAKRTEKAANFLLEKITSHKIENRLLADIIQILGLMKFHNFLPFIPRLLENENEIVRYKCIIVLGWLGGKNEISLLLNTLKSNDVTYIRSFSTTAIRQICFNHPEHTDYVIKNLIHQMSLEKDELVLAIIIITLQDITNCHFGLKESETGRISGNLEIAKENIRKYNANGTNCQN